MSSIDQAKESIKKKMSLMDYEGIPQSDNTATQQEVKTLKQEKVKVTVYLTEEHWKMFNNLCLQEMKRSGKPEKSQIICDAIEALYKARQ
jgi:hypothetical protein